jgi:hypothetical protein
MSRLVIVAAAGHDVTFTHEPLLPGAHPYGYQISRDRIARHLALDEADEVAPTGIPAEHWRHMLATENPSSAKELAS